MINEEAGFLKALSDAPGDEPARLAYADWLEERSDPRALWLRHPDLYRWTAGGARDPLPGLIAALGEDGTWEVVLRGLFELGGRAVPALIERIRTDPGPVRRHALEVVRGLGPAAADCLPELQRLLEAE